MNIIDEIIKIIPILTVIGALITFSINTYKTNKLTKAANFTKLHTQLYKDTDISDVIILLHGDKLEKDFFINDGELCKKVITTLGFFDMLCHLYANRFLGKSEYEYFSGEMHLLTHNASIINYLLHLESENVEIVNGKNLSKTDFVDSTLPYTTLQIHSYIRENGCSVKKAYLDLYDIIRDRSVAA